MLQAIGMNAASMTTAITTPVTTVTTNIEIFAPDIEPWRNGNTGIEFVHTFDSGKPGPHVMINAVTHGNEICGAIAVDRLLRMSAAKIRPMRGKLSFSFANVEAFSRFNPADPHATRFVDEDFNRVWTAETLDGPRDSAELRRARELRPIINEIDLLLDIHSMHSPHGPVMICGPLDKGIAFAKQVGIPAHIVSDVGHANGTRMRDYGGFGDPASAKNALLVECGQHWEKSAEAVAWQAVWRFLKVAGIMDPALVGSHIDRTPSPAQQVIHVTDAVIARTADFKFTEGLNGLSMLSKKGDLIATDDKDEVRAPYDNCVLIMPTLIDVKPGLMAVRLGRVK
jgi:predicted deacylase